MSNPRNSGFLVGRVAADPVVFENADGSKKVSFSVYADRNFKNSAGQRDSDSIPVEAFVRATTDGLGPFDNVHQGDLVALSTTLRQNVYVPKGGTDKVYKLIVQVEEITYLESRASTQGRLKERLQKAAEANAGFEQPATAPVGSPIDADLPFQG